MIVIPAGSYYNNKILFADILVQTGTGCLMTELYTGRLI